MKCPLATLEGMALDDLLGDDQLHHLRWLSEFGYFGVLGETAALDYATIGQRIVSGAMRSARASEVWDCFEADGTPYALIGRSLFSAPAFATGVCVDCSLIAEQSVHGLTAPTEKVAGLAPWVVGRDQRVPALAGLKEPADLIERSHQRFEVARGFLQMEEYEFVDITDSGLRSLDAATSIKGESLDKAEYRRHLDQEVGKTIESLTSATTLLIVGVAEGYPGYFILLPADSLAGGELQEIGLQDLMPTLLAVAGHRVPDSMEGIVFAEADDLSVSAGQGLAAEDEAILRERLSGLGYIE